MNKEIRKSFAELKAKCNTPEKRKAFNKLISTFAASESQIQSLINSWYDDHIQIKEFLGRFNSIRSVVSDKDLPKGKLYEDCLYDAKHNSKGKTLYAFKVDMVDDYEEGTWHYDTLLVDSGGLDMLINKVSKGNKAKDKSSKILKQLQEMDDQDYVSFLWDLLTDAIDSEKRRSADKEIREVLSQCSYVADNYKRGWRQDYFEF